MRASALAGDSQSRRSWYAPKGASRVMDPAEYPVAAGAPDQVQRAGGAAALAGSCS